MSPEEKLEKVKEILESMLPGEKTCNNTSVERGFATGRSYLRVCGHVTVVEGDICRDVRFGHRWEKADMVIIEEKFNLPIHRAIQIIKDGKDPAD